MSDESLRDSGIWSRENLADEVEDLRAIVERLEAENARLRQQVTAGEAFFGAARPYIRAEWTVLSSLKQQQVESEAAWLVAWKAVEAYEAAVQAPGSEEASGE